MGSYLAVLPVRGYFTMRAGVPTQILVTFASIVPMHSVNSQDNSENLLSCITDFDYGLGRGECREKSLLRICFCGRKYGRSFPDCEQDKKQKCADCDKRGAKCYIFEQDKKKEWCQVCPPGRDSIKRVINNTVVIYCEQRAHCRDCVSTEQKSILSNLEGSLHHSIAEHDRDPEDADEECTFHYGTSYCFQCGPGYRHVKRQEEGLMIMHCKKA